MNDTEKCHQSQWIVFAGCGLSSPGLQHAAILCRSTNPFNHGVHYTQQKDRQSKTLDFYTVFLNVSCEPQNKQ